MTEPHPLPIVDALMRMVDDFASAHIHAVRDGATTQAEAARVALRDAISAVLSRRLPAGLVVPDGPKSDLGKAVVSEWAVQQAALAAVRTGYRNLCLLHQQPFDDEGCDLCASDSPAPATSGTAPCPRCEAKAVSVAEAIHFLNPATPEERTDG